MKSREVEALSNLKLYGKNADMETLTSHYFKLMGQSDAFGSTAISSNLYSCELRCNLNSGHLSKTQSTHRDGSTWRSGRQQSLVPLLVEQKHRGQRSPSRLQDKSSRCPILVP